MRHRDPVLVSAHRCGAGEDTASENTLHALERSLALGVEYVEFDLQRRDDGSLVVLHDDDGRVDVVRYDALLAALAGRAHAHVDLKFGSPGGVHEIAAVHQALDALGAGPHVVTTGRAATARALRAWADAEGRDLLVGLAVGSGVAGLPWREQVRRRWAELFPGDRVAASRADVLVAHHLLALLTLRRLARRRGLRLLVWTPDHPLLLAYWMRRGRAWLVTTNHPARALALRAGRLRP
ncbi:MAG TPA: glycerophosphodiester phosphodiesterase family protein [Nocardioides sp.]|uniref:glycerophosphodiester phosphodiesterase family protein n=1 Tax=Nocardioides sp. TaxID=35761 RepID=UPI002EDB69D8